MFYFLKKHFYKRKLRRLNQRIRDCAKYDLWRRRVLERDDHQCIECGATMMLEVDHITPFAVILKKNKVRSMKGAYKCHSLWETRNGRTLCHECHRKTPTYLKRYG